MAPSDACLSEKLVHGRLMPQAPLPRERLQPSPLPRLGIVTKKNNLGVGKIVVEWPILLASPRKGDFEGGGICACGRAPSPTLVHVFEPLTWVETLGTYRALASSCCSRF